MQRYKILHRTYYNFSAAVRLEPHILHLRPREDHELRIDSSTLEITPPATLRWYRDVEDNSVAIATFDAPANQLEIESEVLIQQYNQAPLDFLVAEYAMDYPFAYTPEDRVVLSPYMTVTEHSTRGLPTDWVAKVWQPGERLQTYALLQRLSVHIQQTLSYQLREEPGVQSAAETLACGTGSCRDFAYLFMEAARRLGLASRFVSGYLHAPPSAVNFGATHAWAEVYLPGAGWKGFDPTNTKGVLYRRSNLAVKKSDSCGADSHRNGGECGLHSSLPQGRDEKRFFGQRGFIMGLLLLSVLMLFLVGGPHGFGYHSYGYDPSGLVGMLVIVLLVLLLTERF